MAKQQEPHKQSQVKPQVKPHDKPKENPREPAERENKLSIIIFANRLHGSKSKRRFKPATSFIEQVISSQVCEGESSNQAHSRKRENKRISNCKKHFCPSINFQYSTSKNFHRKLKPQQALCIPILLSLINENHLNLNRKPPDKLKKLDQ